MGVVLAILSAGGLVFVFGLQVLGVESSPYFGMLAYLGLPGFLTLGLLIIPVGMVWEARRRRGAARRGEGVPPALQLDFGNPRHLYGVMGFAATTVIILAVFGATAYRAVDFMDSPTFCGQLCHTVMEPQSEPYKRSAHAEVECTTCHIGPGANWFVQSKLSGARQVIATLSNTFPRPIPAPIENLRPARATCEDCHWREKAYGLRLGIFRSYLPDEDNTPQTRALAFRVGSGGEEARGVHWHTSARVFYRAADEQRQVLAWVAVEDEDGQTREWVNPQVDEEAELGEQRLMDCIDCHNRTAHKIPSPAELIDDAFDVGRLDSSLPYLKREGLRLLGDDGSNPSTERILQRWARDGWFEQLEEFYRQGYPELAAAKEKAIQEAIAEFKKMSEMVLFSDMNTSWRTYADNRGHMGVQSSEPGCFRCHGVLESVESGELLSGGFGNPNCAACHGVGGGARAAVGDHGPDAEKGCGLCHISIAPEQLEPALAETLPRGQSTRPLWETGAWPAEGVTLSP